MALVVFQTSRNRCPATSGVGVRETLSGKPFDEAVPWRAMNPVLKTQPGLLAKTWLSGLHTSTPGGFYAFGTLKNATAFALDYFPSEAATLDAAF